MYHNPHTALRKRRWSHGLALALSGGTLLLLAAGALVTSTGSSLAVPDWPLAYGQVFPPMVGGILYEHGHRLVAAAVGILTIVLAAWLWWADGRRWVQVAGVAAVALVVFQGVLGGITVLLLLPKAVSVGHALTAQGFFLLTVFLAQVTAPGWAALHTRRREPGRARVWGRALFTVLVLELGLGATMRHNAAGLAIPDFPLAYGGLVPPLGSFPITVHYLHRLGALAIVILVGGTIWATLGSHRHEPALVRVAWTMGALVGVQVVLGAFVIWSRLAVPLPALHLVNGALLLGTAGLFTLRAELLEVPPPKTTKAGG